MTQLQALKEEGIEVVLINPNVATVQTSKSLGKASPDKVHTYRQTRLQCNQHMHTRTHVQSKDTHRR